MEVVHQWRTALAAAGGPDTLIGATPESASWLDLSHAHPSGLAQLLAGRPTPLSSLVRDAAAHRAARSRGRAIRASAGELAAQRGIRACYLAAGIAGWSGGSPEVNAPVVLRGCAVRLRSAGLDYELHLDETAVINPELVRALAARHGVTIDGAELGGLAFGRDGFDPRPVYAWLQERCAAVPGFRIDRSLVVATFTAGSGAVLADLDAATDAVGRHDLLARVVADDRLPADGALGHRPAGVAPPQGFSERDEGHLVLDLDPAQRRAVEAALRGEHVVVEGPPGTGATQVLAATVVALAARGRRVLVVTPRRTSADLLLARLASVGMSGLALDLQEGPRETPEARAALAAALEEVVVAPRRLGERPQDGSPEDDLPAARRRAEVETTSIHAVRAPWRVSAYEAMAALSDLTARPSPPRTRVRLAHDVLARIDAPSRERLRADLRAAATAGAFRLTRRETRWLDARLATVEQAQHALLAAAVVRDHLPGARAAMERVTGAAGLRRARTAADWLPLLDLLTGVRETVDVMLPGVFEADLPALVAAVDPAARGDRGERRRLRRAAQALVRPGVHVPDLHGVLARAERRRRSWAEVAQDGEGPRVPVGLTASLASVAQIDAGLTVLGGVFAGGDCPDLRTVTLEELQQRVIDLAGDTDGALGQPRRAILLASLDGAGLGALVEDLRARRAPVAEVDGELDLAWWSSVLEAILRSDPVLAAHHVGPGRQALSSLLDAEARHLAGAPARVGEAVVARARDVAGAQAGQVRWLRGALGGEGRAPGPAELVRHAADLVHALRPVWLMSPDTVARALPRVGGSGRPVVDVVVVDDANQVSMPEVAAALARGAQIVVAGDRRRVSPPVPLPQDGREVPTGSLSVMEALAPVWGVHRLDRDHRTRDGRLLGLIAARYPEGWTRTRGTASAPALRLDVVTDGTAVAPLGEDTPLSADAEVAHVVRLVGEHAAARPDESLLVVTLDERHAGRIEDGLRGAAAERPELGRWLAVHWNDTRVEPFAVRVADRVMGQERDAVILAVGLARTPHGRVLHRFGTLEEPDGAGRLICALSRARLRTTVVCCFGAADLVAERLRGDGPRMLQEVLLAASVVADDEDDPATWPPATAPDPLVADLRDRLVTAGLPVLTGVGDADWPLDIAVLDPRVPGRLLVAVDLDGAAYAAVPVSERGRDRAARWEQAGWVYCRVSALDLFRDPAAEVERVRQAWFRSMAALAGRGELLPPVRPLRPRTEGDVSRPDDSPASRPPDAAPEAAPAADAVSAAEAQEANEATAPRGASVVSTRGADDQDVGWGGRPDADSDDERYLRERPPHWD